MITLRLQDSLSVFLYLETRRKIMAKHTVRFSVKGFLNMDDMTVTEVKKDEEHIYDFLEQLRSFDGKEVTINIAEDIEIHPIEE